MAAVTTRPAEPKDAEAIGRLSRELEDYLRSLGDRTSFSFGAAEFLRDGFGPARAFDSLVAEDGTSVVGYAVYHAGYDTDRGERVLHLVDLVVGAASRGRGIGRALMRAVADAGRQHDARFVLWSVYRPNEAAKRFYERLGARYLNDLDFMVLPL